MGTVTNVTWINNRQSEMIGPFVDGNDNLYVVLPNSSDNTSLDVLKSANGGSTWSAQDTSNRPNLANNVEAVGVYQNGTRLHIVTQQASNPQVHYHTFDTSDAGTGDVWVTGDETVTTVPDADEANVSIVVLSTGVVIVAYQGERDANKGTRYQRVDYAWRSTGGSWTADIAVDGGGNVNYYLSGIALGASNKTHIVYFDDTNDDHYHKSLTSGLSLSSAEVLQDNAPDTNAVGTHPVYYDAAGTERITTAWRRNSDSGLYTSKIDSDGTPDAEESTGDTANTAGTPARILACLAVDTTNDTVYAVTYDGSDIYVNENVNDGGWGTGASSLTVSGIVALSARFYNNGTQDVIGIVYEDADSVEYYEHTFGTTYPQSVAGAISPSGAQTRQTNKAVAGAISPSGAITKVISRAVSGAISPSSALNKVIQRALDGSIAPSGALSYVRLYFRSVAGAISPSGAITKVTQKAVAGAVTPSGAITKVIQHIVSGNVSPSGTLNKIIQTRAAGAISPASALTKIAQRAVDGSIAPSSAVSQITQKLVAGAISPASAITKAISKVVVGTVAPSGSVTKITQKALSGAITPTGTLSSAIVFVRTVLSSLSFSGDLTTVTQKAVAGAIAPSGTLTKITQKALTGAISPSGALSSAIVFVRAVASVLSFSGDLTKVTQKAVAGNTSPASSLTKQINRAVAGAVAPSGTLSRVIKKALAGVIDPVSELNKVIQRIVASILAPSSTASGAKSGGGTTYQQAVSGTLSFAGVLSKETSKRLAGVISPSSGLTKIIQRALASVLSFTGGLYWPPGAATLTHAVASTATFTHAVASTATFTHGYATATFTHDVASTATFTHAVASVATFVDQEIT